MSPQSLRTYADAVHRRGAALDNVWGFIDGTVRQCSRPKQNQQAIYNGHKKVHGIKFQSVSTPNGLITNLYGPVEGQRHDSTMLMMSNLLNQLNIYSHDPAGNVLCLYGDPAYPLSQYLQAPFRLRGAPLTQQQIDFNKSMSSVRVSVEWKFADVVNTFKFIDFKKNMKIGLSPIAKIYKVSAILSNAHACLYGNNTSGYFDVDPPIIHEYFA